jgi:hypothetical protein
MTNPAPLSSALTGALIALVFLTPFVAANLMAWLTHALTGSLLLGVAGFFVSCIVFYAALFGWTNAL